jgi:hypothetical protein
MGRPRTPDSVKKAKGTYRRPLIEECPGAYKRKQKAETAERLGVVTPELCAAYCEGIDEIEALVHEGDMHVVPDSDSVDYIRTIEDVLNPHLPINLKLNGAQLFSWINEANARYH